MRLALVVGSGYEKNQQLTPIPSADLDCELLARRLSESDAAFRVIRLEAERGLAERLEQRLLAQTEPIESLLVFFSGYCVLSAERGAALLLDGDRLGTFSLPRLRKLLEHFAPSSCLIVDAAAVVDAQQSLPAVVAAIGESLTVESPGVSALCAVRRSDAPDSFGGSAFSGQVLMVIDWLAASREPGQAVDLAWLYEGLRADVQVWGAIPAAGIFPERPTFVLLPADTPPPPRFEVSPLPIEAPPLPIEAPLAAAFPPPPPPIARREAAPRRRAPVDPGLDDLDALLGFPAPNAASVHDEEPAPDSVTPVRPPGSIEPLPVEPAKGAALDAVFSPPAIAPHAEAASDLGAALPSFGSSTALADELFEAGRIERAVEEYEAAFVLVDDARERATVLARWARALGRLGRYDVAAARLDEAAALEPQNVEILALRAEWAESRADAAGARDAALAWLAVEPNQPRALGLLADAATVLGEVQRALEARCRLARFAPGSREEKARALSDAAELAERELGDRALSLELASEALALTPGAPALLARVGALLESGGSPAQLFAYYEQALEQAADPATIIDLVTKLDNLSSAVGDPTRAARCLERLVAMRPSDLSLRDRLIDLYFAGSDAERALGHCRVAARLMPTRAGTYRRAQALFEAAGALDGAWNAASVLDCLGEADINEALLASQHKPDGLLAARGTISDAEWRSALFADERDRELFGVLGVLGASGVRVGIGFAKHKLRYAEPDPATLQDPEKSTTMLAKTLGWTARLLGLAPPSLYVQPELPGGLDVAPTEQPSVLASRTLGSGLSLGQLAFLWGRHLPRYRAELRALSFFRSEEDLSSLIAAALALGGAPGHDLRALDGDVKRLYAALRREVRGPELDELGRIAQRFPVSEIGTRTRRLLSAIERVGVRAGLVACGDVAAAADLLRRFPVNGAAHTDELLGELYAFAISEQYQALRRHIGVAIAA